MQSILLEVDERINANDLIEKITSLYGSEQIKTFSLFNESNKTFGTLPDIFINPIQTDDFRMYTREELNER
ncbi:hypothetical protein FACS1894111_03920 [Clostridia bacterium]|nr:hypothetical protein FACS1894111_03920 [Clostridia bacterium]